MKKNWHIRVGLGLAILVAGCGTFRGEPPLPSPAALQEEPSPTPEEFKALEEDVASLHEELAEVKRKHVNTLVKMGELYGAMEKLEAELAAEAPPSAEARAPEPSEGTAHREEGKAMKDPKAAYDAALSLYGAGEYAEAGRGFQAFVESFPDNPLADNAQYWLGESYFARKAYLQALDAFEQVESRYPKGNKVPDALLKIGMAYANLGEYDRAVSQLEELIERFPSNSLVNVARMEIRRIKERQP